MHEMIQPYLEEVVQILITIISMMIIAALAELRGRVLRWIDSRTTKEQRDLIYRIAGEAFSYAEQIFREAGGERKLEVAMQYVSRQLKRRGLDLTEEEIRAAIERAVLEYNERNPKEYPLGEIPANEKTS